MVDRVWIGGGNNQASNPNDWSPTGVPQPGDILAVTTASTISVKDNDLQGDTLNTTAPLTLDLSDFAKLSLTSATTVNAFGIDWLNYNGFPVSQLTINLANFSLLYADISLGWFARTVISGGPLSFVDFTGTTHLNGGILTIDANVIGSSTFNVALGGLTDVDNSGGSLEFGGLVSPGQTVDVAGAQLNLQGSKITDESSVTIDQPHLFFGTIDLNDYGFADLVGLAQADSWSYKNDLLSIQDASGQRIDLVHVVSDASSTGDVHGLSVSMTAAGDVVISPGTGFQGHIGSATT